MSRAGGEFLDHPGYAVVGVRPRDLIGHSESLGRRVRHRHPTAGPGEHLGVVGGIAEGEYLVSIEDHADNFFYSWTELGVTPVEWLRVGAVGQRTRVFDGEPWIDRGLFAGVTIHDVTLTAYAFNFDDDERFWVLSVGTSFLKERP